MDLEKEPELTVQVIAIDCLTCYTSSAFPSRICTTTRGWRIASGVWETCLDFLMSIDDQQSKH